MVPSSVELSLRIFICIILGLGLGYGALILGTFRRYGTKMDEAWKNRVARILAANPQDPPWNRGSYWQPETLPIMDPIYGSQSDPRIYSRPRWNP